MVGGLRRPKKRTAKNEERRPQPLVTPAQRILQQQWLQPATPQRTPRVRLPEGTEIVPVAAKRPRTEAAGESRARDHQERVVVLQNIRISTVVPELLSPLSSNHDEDEIHVEEAAEGEVTKMADPTPSEQAETKTAHAPSAGDVPSMDEATTTVTIVAEVHAPAEPAHAPAEPAHTPAQPAHAPAQPARELGGESHPRGAMAAVGEAIEVLPSPSQEEFDRKFAEMVNWKRTICEGLAEHDRNLARMAQEEEILLNRLRELRRARAEEERVRETKATRLNEFKDLFSK